MIHGVRLVASGALLVCLFVLSAPAFAADQKPAAGAEPRPEIYKVGSIEEASALTHADPAVKPGRLKVEMHPWMVQKGILS